MKLHWSVKRGGIIVKRTKSTCSQQVKSKQRESRWKFMKRTDFTGAWIKIILRPTISIRSLSSKFQAVKLLCLQQLFATDTMKPSLPHIYITGLYMYVGEWGGELREAGWNYKWRVTSQRLHSSGYVWESRWTSWAVRPNEPSGFRGRKDLVHRASALVTTCP